MLTLFITCFNSSAACASFATTLNLHISESCVNTSFNVAVSLIEILKACFPQFPFLSAGAAFKDKAITKANESPLVVCDNNIFISLI